MDEPDGYSLIARVSRIRQQGIETNISGCLRGIVSTGLLTVPEFRKRSPGKEEKNHARNEPTDKAEDPGYPEVHPGNGNGDEGNDRNNRVREEGNDQDNQYCRLHQLDFQLPEFLAGKCFLPLFKDTVVRSNDSAFRQILDGVARCCGSSGNVPEPEAALRTEKGLVIRLITTAGTVHDEVLYPGNPNKG
jgi:hypothetical protein